MARRTIRKGKITTKCKIEYVSNRRINSIAAAAREKQTPQKGPRAVAYETYKKCGDIQKAIDAVAERFGKGAFSDSVIIGWIKEEIEKEKLTKRKNGREDRDDDDGR